MFVYPIFLPLEGCPFRCIYCDQYAITGEDNYTLDSHIEDIARFCSYHKGEDKEIAFFGGTFTSLPIKWQEEQFKKLLPFLDETTFIRYSTRPDCITQADIDLGKRYNLRTIELGIQDFSDEVLKKSCRGYGQEIAVDGCNLVKRNGINLGIQLMPGLPGYSVESAKETVKTTLDIAPKYVRIYPTVVLKSTVLADLYNKEEFKPLTLEDALIISSSMKSTFEKSGIVVIKIGVQIDSNYAENIVAGPYHKAFGELVRAHQYVSRILEIFSDTGDILSINYSNRDASLLKGHNNYGKNLLISGVKPKIINLNIDNNLRKGTVQINLKEECKYYEI